jgi:probable HAF family extracellular repeat protein
VYDSFRRGDAAHLGDHIVRGPFKPPSGWSKRCADNARESRCRASCPDTASVLKRTRVRRPGCAILEGMRSNCSPEAPIITTAFQFSASLIVPLLIAFCPVNGVAQVDRFVTLDAPGSEATMARGINAGGQVTGTYMQAGVTHGFLYSGGTYAAIDVPGAAATNPSGIDRAGRIAGF